MGTWPWAAIIGFPTSNGGVRVVCGGTLISDRHVLSAAHCFQRSNNPTIVRLGDLDIRTTAETQHEDYRIDNVLNHPRYITIRLRTILQILR